MRRRRPDAPPAPVFHTSHVQGGVEPLLGFIPRARLKVSTIFRRRLLTEKRVLTPTLVSIPPPLLWVGEDGAARRAGGGEAPISQQDARCRSCSRPFGSAEAASACGQMPFPGGGRGGPRARRGFVVARPCSFRDPLARDWVRFWAYPSGSFVSSPTHPARPRLRSRWGWGRRLGSPREEARLHPVPLGAKDKTRPLLDRPCTYYLRGFESVKPPPSLTPRRRGRPRRACLFHGPCALELLSTPTLVPQNSGDLLIKRD